MSHEATPPAPPPGLNPAALAPPPPPVAPSTPGLEQHPPTPRIPGSVGFTISPIVLDWIPVGCLIAAFVLSFFSWVEAIPGGHTIFSQSAWGILGADMSVTAVEDPLIKKASAYLEKDNGLQTEWLILPYLVFLIVTLALAVIERVFRNPTILTVPGPLAWLPAIWPKRFAILTILSALLLVFLFGYMSRGRGLPSGLREFSEKTHKQESEQADDSIKKTAVQIKIGQDYGKFCVRTTFARTMVVLLHIVALLVMLGRWWLDRRGQKPLPRVVLQL